MRGRPVCLTPTHAESAFHCLGVVRQFARRSEDVRAWGLRSAHLASWAPMDALQVFPVELLVDPWLSKLMSDERCRFVLSLPRGDGVVPV